MSSEENISKYQKAFQAPPNFQGILKEFTREVLRENPENIYEFGVNYFTNMKNRLRQRNQ